jgi:hypothetical protein
MSSTARGELDSGSFADHLDWLLTNVPRRPGCSDRFDLEDLLTALVGEAPRETRWEARSSARSWIEGMRSGQTVASPTQSRHYLTILEGLFRLPAGYFDDEPTRKATDERILFAVDAAERGVTVIGPCRVGDAPVSLEALHSMYRRARTQLGRRAGV